MSDGREGATGESRIGGSSVRGARGCCRRDRTRTSSSFSSVTGRWWIERGSRGLVSSDRSRKAEILASRDEGRKVRVMSRGSYRLDRGSRRLGVAISLRVAAVFDAPERLRIVAGGEGGIPVSVEGVKGKKSVCVSDEARRIGG